MITLKKEFDNSTMLTLTKEFFYQERENIFLFYPIVKKSNLIIKKEKNIINCVKYSLK